MLRRRLCGSGMGSNEQGEYCSSVFCSDLDHLNCDINYPHVLYFTYFMYIFALAFVSYNAQTLTLLPMQVMQQFQNAVN